MTNRLVPVLVTTALVVVLAGAALAHPLGNFTISHHVGIHLQPDTSELKVILDFAEIPTFQTVRAITDTDTLNATQADTLGSDQCDSLLDDIRLMTGDRPIQVEGTSSELAFLPGEGDLQTMKITCNYTFPTPTSFPAEIEIRDESFGERIGWREIVITSEGVEIQSDALTTSPTGRLSVYPSDGASSPRNDRTALVTLIGPGAGTGRDVSDVAVAPSVPPTIIQRIGRALSPDQLSETPLIVAVLAALGLGFAHAVAPGHGKTLVAAYLVGNRGTWRHAVALGSTVAVSHTIGVAALGAVTFAASAAFTPERVYPYLATVSGLIILGMGAYLVVRTWRAGRTHEHEHEHEHGHGHDHGDPDMHTHGGRAHSHTIPTDITWKGLAALGISGGLVPSASAVVLLLGAVNLGRTGLGLILVLLFGVGMATALVAAGLLVVGAERVGMRAFGNRPWITRIRRVLPMVMAAAVLIVGVLLTLNAVTAVMAA